MMTALFTRKLLVAALFCSVTSNLCAEGIVNFRPTIGVDTTYDDNVYRFSNPAQAEAIIGTSSTSDTILRTELGLAVDLRLSRQLISVTGNISKSQYNRFDQLNNDVKSLGLVWDWQLGNYFFGEVGFSDAEVFSGFNELRTASINIRNDKQRYATANWQLHPNWIANINASYSSSENSLAVFDFFNNEYDALQAGVQYANLRGTQLGLAYRNSTRYYKNNGIDRLVFFGDENNKKELILNAAWVPTPKFRISTRFSKVDLEYNNLEFSNILPKRSFSGLNKRIRVDYLTSAKTSIGFTVYDEIFEVEELSSTFLKYKGIAINPSWKPTDKLNLTASWEIINRDFLGDSGISSVNSLLLLNRDDKTDSKSISLTYLPTRKSLISLTYTGADRKSNVDAFSYEFNMLNLALRYFF